LWNGNTKEISETDYQMATTKKNTTPRTASTAYSQRQNKAAEKLRNLAESELDHRQRELNDQLFRLKFQLKMGQTESLKKMRGLKKDIARSKTILRGRQIGLEPAPEKR
jgi:large subunit ribosomal protein L29